MSDYLLKRRAISQGTREKDPPKEKKPLKQVSDKKKAQDLADKEAGIKPEKKFPKRGFAGRSEKMKGIMQAIIPLYRAFLEEHPDCEIRSPECTGPATAVHHTAGRSMAKIMDKKTWKGSCDHCNLYVEKNDQWARDNGFKVSRHQKQP